MTAMRRIAALSAGALLMCGAVAMPLASAGGALVEGTDSSVLTPTTTAATEGTSDDAVLGDTALAPVEEAVEEELGDEVESAEQLIDEVTAPDPPEPEPADDEPGNDDTSGDTATDPSSEADPASDPKTSSPTAPFSDLKLETSRSAAAEPPGPEAVTVAAPANGGSEAAPAAATQPPPSTPTSGDVPIYSWDLASGGSLTSLPEARPVRPDGRSTAEFYELIDGLGLTPQLVARLLAPFPVAGKAHYGDDWHVQRSVPTAHLHEGTDIFAAKGTPVIAAADGVVERMVRDSAVGGTSLRLTTADGTFYYYAHLDRFAPKLIEGERVQKGDVLGFVGTTGNASATAPHLHFEIHPGGGEAVSPVPYLDRWLGEALQAARTVAGAPVSQSALRHASSASGAAASDSPPEADGADVSDARPISSTTALPAAGVFALIAIGWKVRRALTRGTRLRAAVTDAAPLRFSEADLLRFAEELADEAVTADQR